METIFTQKHGTIYIDYAHNYGSMKALLSFLKRKNPHSKVTVVVGSTGNKGVSRRSGFGKALSEYADTAYLTTDDPGFEDPQKIAEEIDQYIDHKRVQVQIILDRKMAIKTAISQSQPGDLVVLAGKGEDAYQKIRGIDTPYPNDFNVAQQVVRKLE